MFSLMIRPKSPFGEHPGLMHFETSEPSSENNTTRAPVYKSSIPPHLLKTSNPMEPSGDHRDFQLVPKGVPRPVTKASEIAVVEPLDVNRDLLSGYDEYLREFHENKCEGTLRVTPQGTLSLALGHNMQVDVAIDGAIRVVNPKAFIAMSVNGESSATAVMHPLGRFHHDGDTTLLMAFDLSQKNHKFAKLWRNRSTFKSVDMSMAFTMDSAGTRTTLSHFPFVATNDISLPVFYDTAPHGANFRAEAAKLKDSSTQYSDEQGNAVWNINSTIVKYRDGELRVMRPPNLHLRTSAVSGCLALSTEQIHSTATQGGMSHMFVRFGENKMHFDGTNFKLRTCGQSAGFDENNRICLF